jgi:16S rRNA G527 N7-methylase RsmG
MPFLQFKKTLFLRQIQAALVLPELTIANSFTEGFTETFCDLLLIRFADE